MFTSGRRWRELVLQVFARPLQPSLGAAFELGFGSFSANKKVLTFHRKRQMNHLCQLKILSKKVWDCTWCIFLHCWCYCSNFVGNLTSFLKLSSNYNRIVLLSILSIESFSVQVSSNGTISQTTQDLVNNQGVYHAVTQLICWTHCPMNKWKKLSTYFLQSTLPLWPKIARNCIEHWHWTSFTLQSLKNHLSFENKVEDSHE